MDNILTPEQAARPVTQADLLSALNELAKMVSQNSAYYQDHMFNAVNEALGTVARAIDELDYKRMRDAYHVISLISELHNLPRDTMIENYIKWCEDFDKMNAPVANDAENNKETEA